MSKDDPWFPIAAMLLVVLTAWLGIWGPLPNGPSGFFDWLYRWQTLVSASVAIGAAWIAYNNTTRSLKHAANLETHRRNRKHAAIRSVLPVALAAIDDYAEKSALLLDHLYSDLSAFRAWCQRDIFPTTYPESFRIKQ